MAKKKFIEGYADEVPALGQHVNETGAISGSTNLMAQRVDTGEFEAAQDDVEYYSPDQYCGKYGIVYRIFHTGNTLPSFLTTGNNVAHLLAYSGEMTLTSAGDRTVYHGTQSGYGTSYSRIRLNLSGTTGNSNLVWDNNTHSPVTGWIDYVRA